MGWAPDVYVVQGRREDRLTFPATSAATAPTVFTDYGLGRNERE